MSNLQNETISIKSKVMSILMHIDKTEKNRKNGGFSRKGGYIYKKNYKILENHSRAMYY